MAERRPGDYDQELERKTQERAELKRREEEFLREQEERRELREIERKRAETEEYLKRRGIDFLERTGQHPSASLVQRWIEESVEDIERERQADHQRRLDAMGGAGPY